MNGIVFDLNEYTDIDVRDFDEYFNKHYITPIIEQEEHIPFLKGKYDVNLTFHRDIDNNKFIITGEIIDYSKHQTSTALKEALDEIVKKK